MDQGENSLGTNPANNGITNANVENSEPINNYSSNPASMDSNSASVPSEPSMSVPHSTAVSDTISAVSPMSTTVPNSDATLDSNSAFDPNIGSPASSNPISSSSLPQSDVTPQVGSNVPIISSADIAPPTLANAPIPLDPLHPTGSVVDENGDIVIGNGRTPFNKKPLIIAGIVGAVLLFMLVLILPLFSQNASQKVLLLFQEKLSSTEQIEKFFQKVYFHEVTTADIMTSETHDMLNKNIPQFTNFQEKLAKINPNKVSSEVYDDVKKVQDMLSRLAPQFKSSLDLYNVMYGVYQDGQTDRLGDYLGSENYTVQVIAERFDNYVKEKAELRSAADANGCNLEESYTDGICAEIVPEYQDTINSMNESYAVPQGIFFAYDNEETDYTEEDALVNAMQRVIEELEKS